ncbi:hypothetical protein FOS14_22035 [Skermania sp. ID1734]|uniref:type VII secretion target n=1 Tax=Skermania sp. ID1734 TaxID=2597516 RepID=UPI00117EA09D|nr:type VII secretion target [Skermania sp. ID1734]TSD93958.1 hypothetical protein FOS14_22035 [Skermania sp. ID1734]
MSENVVAAVKQMSSALSGSELRVDPQSAEACAKHCDALAEGFKDHARAARALNTVVGFGTLQSGLDLRKGFERKAVAAADHLESLAKAALDLATAFRTAGQSYVRADEEAAALQHRVADREVRDL